MTSREYKIMLNTGRFEDREGGCEAISQLIDFLAKRQASLTGGVAAEQMLTDGKPDDELREVCYFDTPAQALRQSRFILRVRSEVSKFGKRKFQTTLKYRDADRRVSASKNVEPAVAIEDDDRKFEEDVVPLFQVKYSRSTSIKTKDEPSFRSQEEVVAMFPGLASLEISGKTVAGANALFASLQKHSDWVDPSSTTKTEYAYDAL